MLELTIAGTIFVVFASQFSSVWITTNKQMRFLMDRAKLVRETYITRAMLTSDFAYATQVTVVTADEEFHIDSDSHAGGYNYALKDGKLIRFDPLTNSSMTVTSCLGAMTTELHPGYFSTIFNFSKNGAFLNLNFTWQQFPYKEDS